MPADWWAPDRATMSAAVGLAARFDWLADAVRLRAQASGASGRLRLAGFSLGAFVALEVASRLPECDLALELIAPAAPLAEPSLLPQMAGGAVFAMAARHPARFTALVRAQALAARLAPGLLARALLASARGADKALAADPAFRAGMAANLRAGLRDGGAGYATEIAGYVGDWAATLSTISHPVTIWQGEADNWVPPAMARALAAALPGCQALHLLPELSHYSTLRAWLTGQGG